MKRFAFLSLLPFFLLAGAVRWQVLGTDHYNLVYPKGYDGQARWAVRWLESNRDKVNDLVGHDPGKVWIIIEDMGMTVNGFSNTVGNEIHLFTTPPSGLDLSTRDWMRTVGIHEYTHEVSLSSVWGLPGVLRILLGPWVIPNAATPGWLIEGVTVYTESHIVPYEGRLEAGEYDANVLTRASQGVLTKTWNMDGAFFDYPADAIYAYGGPFYEWLAETKGEDAVRLFYKKHGSRIPILSLDRSARDAFDQRFPSLVKDWQASVMERALDFIPADSAAEKLTANGWYIFGGMAADGERIYYSRGYGMKRAALYFSYYLDIIAYDPRTGKEEVLKRPLTEINTSIRVHDGVLYYGALVYGLGFPNTSDISFGELSEIRALDIESRRETVIYKGKVRAFDRLPDGSFLISEDRENAEFGSILKRIPQGGRESEVLWEGDTLIGEILVSDDGRVYITARPQGVNWDIWEYSENSHWKQLTNTPWSESGLSLDTHGRILYSANPYGTDGVVGSYAFDPQSGTIEKFKTPSFTQNPVVLGDKLYFMSLNPKGYDLYSAKPELVEAVFPAITPQVLAPAEPSWNGEFKPRSRFSPYLTLLQPWVRVPYLIPTWLPERGITHLPIGFYLEGGDVISENYYSLTADYDVIGYAPSVNFSWGNLRLCPLEFWLDAGVKPAWDDNDSLDGYEYLLYPSMDMPLLRRPAPGLNSIYWDEGFQMVGRSLDYRSVESSISTSFGWPHWGFAVDVSHSWESPVFSSRERSIINARGAASLDLFGGVLVGDISTRLDLSAESQVLYTCRNPIRGYYTDLSTDDWTFQTATLEYRHRLLKMRFGIWNPNIFFEDLYVNVFADAAFDSREILGASAGLLLVPEVHIAWSFLYLDPMVGAAITLDQGIQPIVGISTSIPFDLGRKRKDALEFIKKPWDNESRDSLHR